MVKSFGYAYTLSLRKFEPHPHSPKYILLKRAGLRSGLQAMIAGWPIGRQRLTHWGPKALSNGHSWASIIAAGPPMIFKVKYALTLNTPIGKKKNTLLSLNIPTTILFTRYVIYVI